MHEPDPGPRHAFPDIPRTAGPLGDMPADEFRAAGHALVEWIADYLQHAERYPVMAQVEPGAIARSVPSAAPDHGESIGAILADIDRVIVPGLTHWNSPTFFAYFSICASGPGVLADFLSAALNQQAMLWRTSPVATELEAVTLGWLRQLMGLPAPFEGVIYDTASISTLHALAAARERALRGVRRTGLAGRDDARGLRVYCSDQAHSSVEKAVILLGLGHEAVVKIASDEAFRMDVDALDAAIAADREGTASTSRRGHHRHDVDDERGPRAGDRRHLRARRRVAARRRGIRRCGSPRPGHGLGARWRRPRGFARRQPTQVDADAIRPERALLSRHGRAPRGVRGGARVPEDERGARSAQPDGHRRAARPAIQGVEAVVRAAVLRGGGMRSRIAEHLRLARIFAGWVDADPAFERLAPVTMSVVCFRARPAALAGDGAALDVLNERVLNELNADGQIFLSHTRLRGAYALRLAVGHARTTEAHLSMAWDLIRAHAARS